MRTITFFITQVGVPLPHTEAEVEEYAPWPNAEIRFERMQGDHAPGVVRPRGTVTGCTDANGQGSVALTPGRYNIVLPTGDTFRRTLSADPEPLDLSVWLAGGLEPGEPGYDTLLDWIHQNPDLLGPEGPPGQDGADGPPGPQGPPGEVPEDVARKDAENDFGANKQIIRRIGSPEGVVLEDETGAAALTARAGGAVGVLLDRGGEKFNVKTFGAKGDGATDDTDAIQDAIDAAEEAGGGVVLLPPGVYLVSRRGPVGSYNRCLLIGASNITIMGSGDMSVLKAAPGANATVLRTAFTGADGVVGRLHDLEFKDFLIDGDWDNQTWVGPSGGEPDVYDQNGLSVYAADGVRVNNVTVLRTAQDGVTFASCTRIRVTNPVVENTGKNNIAFFLCHDYKVVNPRCINPNDSPDGGVTKPYYTLSADGYSGVGCAYPAATTAPSPDNAGVIIAPYVRGRNGRGVSVIHGAHGIEIQSPDVAIAGHAISLTWDSVEDPSDVLVVGGKLVNTTGGVLSRAISASNGSLVRIIGAETYGTLVFAGCGKVSLAEIHADHPVGEASTVVDVRGCADFRVVSSDVNGRISFNTGTTARASVISTSAKRSINGRANVTQLTAAYNDGDAQELNTTYVRSGAGISTGNTETTLIPLDGVGAGDMVLWSHSNPSGVEQVLIQAQTVANGINLKLTNQSGSTVTVGSGSWYFKVVKRSANIA